MKELNGLDSSELHIGNSASLLGFWPKPEEDQGLATKEPTQQDSTAISKAVTDWIEFTRAQDAQFCESGPNLTDPPDYKEDTWIDGL